MASSQPTQKSFCLVPRFFDWWPLLVAIGAGKTTVLPLPVQKTPPHNKPFFSIFDKTPFLPRSYRPLPLVFSSMAPLRRLTFLFFPDVGLPLLTRFFFCNSAIKAHRMEGIPFSKWFFQYFSLP